jgi:hypothetical protein
MKKLPNFATKLEIRSPKIHLSISPNFTKPLSIYKGTFSVKNVLALPIKVPLQEEPAPNNRIIITTKINDKSVMMYMKRKAFQNGYR